MEKYESDDSFLARWAAGELNPEELAEFEKSEAFKDFDRINTSAQQFSAPPLDKDKSLIEVNEKITFGKRNKSFFRLAIAASVSLLLATATLFSSKTYTTGYGEKLAVVLPDGSKVQLNADSELSHRRFFWMNDRKVSLEGEAFFEVEKGDNFRVKTEYGTTTVLGTKFNVRARPKRFSVRCYEGSVKVAAAEEEIILKPNEGVIWLNGELIAEKMTELLPSWITGISTFDQEALYAVLSELTVQFGIAFKTEGIDLTQKFSGSFNHSDLQLALRSTLEPMDIRYDMDHENQLVILK